MKKFRWFAASFIIVIIFLSCSSVFTGSITGSLVDLEDYDNDNQAAGIADAEVYLYTDSDEMEADLTAWLDDSSVLPDYPEEGEPAYFLKTITDAQGAYTFNGFIWNELFPDYGKTGDRKEIYMLFYHKDYGMTKTNYPVYVVSDVTNRIPLFKLSKILNTAEIAGTVLDAESDEPLANVNVRVWIPESWSYTSGGSIDTSESKFSWNDIQSYSARTNDQGEWRQNISYKMLPSATVNNETVILRITYEANGYIAENEADSRLTDGGWDRDGNGIVDADEDDAFFQSGEITADSYSDLGSISITDEFNTAAITGKVVNSNTAEGEPNVSVRIWIADDWTYASSDPDSIDPAAVLDWPENPDYSLSTNADGEYGTDIRFERMPSESDNRGTVRIRIVFIKNNFLIDSSSDVKLIDGGWDRDGNSSIDADENDAFYDPAEVITADLENDLGIIRIKQTEFNENLTGEVWADTDSDAGTPDELANGIEVWLFYEPDGSLETAEPSDGSFPDFIDTTESIFITADTIERGHFSFSGLEWTDTAYGGNQSKVSYYIYLPGLTERQNGYITTGSAAVKYYLTAGSSNYISLEQ